MPRRTATDPDATSSRPVSEPDLESDELYLRYDETSDRTVTTDGDDDSSTGEGASVAGGTVVEDRIVLS